jgi:hypothetical protein
VLTKSSPFKNWQPYLSLVVTKDQKLKDAKYCLWFIWEELVSSDFRKLFFKNVTRNLIEKFVLKQLPPMTRGTCALTFAGWTQGLLAESVGQARRWGWSLRNQFWHCGGCRRGRVRVTGIGFTAVWLLAWGTWRSVAFKATRVLEAAGKRSSAFRRNDYWLFRVA